MTAIQSPEKTRAGSELTGTAVLQLLSIEVDRKVFDFRTCFMLDSFSFPTVIYIWYEGGGLRPPNGELSGGQASHDSP